MADPIASKTKKKSIIRYEAVVPFFIIVAIIYIYFALFFDMHARHLLEYVGTRANGAEVDIGYFKTSFFNASLDMGNIEVTDATKPTENKVEIGQVKWKMLWDALLRGKVAISNASVLDIRLGTTRKHPGRVLPVDTDTSPSLTDQVRQKAIAGLEKEYSGNVLGDLASILGGGDPKEQLKNLQGSLKSEARIKELQSQLSTKEKEWKDRIDKLPKDKDLNALNDRLKNVKTKDFKNPMEVQQSLQQINDIVKDANSKIEEVKSTGQALNSDLSTYQNSVKDLDKLVEQDISDLESHLKIPKLDAKSLSNYVAGPLFLDKLKKAEFYMNKARKMMPPKKYKGQKEEPSKPTPHERVAGRNYKFGRPKAYPLFWLQKAEISSHINQSAFAGNLDGTLLNLTDDQPTIGVPTTFNFKGDFPKQNVSGVVGELTIDHVTEIPREALKLAVGSYGLADTKLLDSPDASVLLAKADVGSSFNAELSGESVKVALNSKFNKTDYQIQAKQKQLEDLLKKVFAGLPTITLDGGVTGTWSDLKVNLNTNVGPELQAGFQRELSSKIADARAQLKAMVDSKIAEQKQKLTAQFDKVQSQVKGALGAKQAEVDKAKNNLDQAKNQATKEQSKKLENQGKKVLEDLSKQFKF